MREELFEAVFSAFSEGLRQVYPSFDAVPLPKKSDRLFTVFSLDRVQLDRPFPDGKKGVYPFTAFFKVSVLIPMTEPVRTAETYFYQTVLPRMLGLKAMLCEIGPAQVEVKWQRVVLSGTFRMQGLYLQDEEAVG